MGTPLRNRTIVSQFGNIRTIEQHRSEASFSGCIGENGHSTMMCHWMLLCWPTHLHRLSYVDFPTCAKLCKQDGLHGCAKCYIVNSRPTLRRALCWVLQFLITWSLHLYFVAEVQWDNGECIWADEVPEICDCCSLLLHLHIALWEPIGENQEIW